MRGLGVLLVLAILVFSPLLSCDSAEAMAGCYTFDNVLDMDHYLEMQLNLCVSENFRITLDSDYNVDVCFASLATYANFKSTHAFVFREGDFFLHDLRHLDKTFLAPADGYYYILIFCGNEYQPPSHVIGTVKIGAYIFLSDPMLVMFAIAASGLSFVIVSMLISPIRTKRRPPLKKPTEISNQDELMGQLRTIFSERKKTERAPKRIGPSSCFSYIY